MYIKLTKIDKDALMGEYDAIEVTGTKLEDGETWSKAFFANNSELENALDDFTVGEEVNVVMEQNKKNKKFWNIVGFKAMTQLDRDNLAKPKTNYGTKGSGGAKNNNGLSKEEWAEKDRKTNERIARAVALKGAIDNLKEGATVKSIFKRADELLVYLTDGAYAKKIDEDDGLNPPE